MNCETIKGEVAKCMEDVFIGYNAHVTQHEQIQMIYCKLKLLHPAARHIICAFRIPGVMEHEDEDYCDDGEINAGRVVLSWMKEWKVESRAVFIVWYCKGNKLGNKRYECMQQTIESSMLAAGISTKIDQQVESEEEDNSDGVSTQSSQDFQMVNSKKSNRRQYKRQSKSDRRGHNTSENIQGGYARARGTPT